jgi:hypothetical protein
LQKDSYLVIEDTQIVTDHPVHKLASPNLGQASKDREGSWIDAQSSRWVGSQIAQVSDSSFVSTGMVQTRNDPTSCSDAEKSKLSNAARGQFAIDPQLEWRTPPQSQYPNPWKRNDQFKNTSENLHTHSLISPGFSLAAHGNSPREEPEPIHLTTLSENLRSALALRNLCNGFPRD